MNKYDQSILVAFGTAFMPQDATIDNIVEVAKKLPRYGFIIGLKDTHLCFDKTKDLKLDNILINNKFKQKKEMRKSELRQSLLSKNSVISEKLSSDTDESN